jgi:hypothetical protein
MSAGPENLFFLRREIRFPDVVCGLDYQKQDE